MVVGECDKDDEIELNPTKEKKLTNIRTTEKEDKMILAQTREFSIEEAITYIRGNPLLLTFRFLNATLKRR